MKKTVTINISGRVFYIDDDAYTQLQAYLDAITSTFKKQDGGDEIIADIESRVAELFEEKIDRTTGVVSASMVSDVISVMGKPEDFTEEKGSERPPISTALVKPAKRLYRDVDNRIFGGVCAGIAAYFNIDLTLVRVLTAVLAVLTSGTVILIYLILWIALPAAITTAQKLEMRGEHVTIGNIEKTIREEYEEMKRISVK